MESIKWEENTPPPPLASVWFGDFLNARNASLAGGARGDRWCLAQTFALRGRPCPVAGRSLRPSMAFTRSDPPALRPPGCACRLRRLSEHGRPLAGGAGGGALLAVGSGWGSAWLGFGA